MTKGKSKVGRPAIISREFRVTSLIFYVSTHADKPRGREPEIASGAWIDVHGEYDEPILDARSVTMTLHPEAKWTPGPNPPPSIGGIVQFRPHLQAVVHLPIAEFDRAWSLAISGHLKFCYFACTEPRKRYSAIVSVAMSNRSEDEDRVDPKSPSEECSLS